MGGVPLSYQAFFELAIIDMPTLCVEVSPNRQDARSRSFAFDIREAHVHVQVLVLVIRLPMKIDHLNVIVEIIGAATRTRSPLTCYH